MNNKDIYEIERNGKITTILIEKDDEDKFSVLSEKTDSKYLYSELVAGNLKDILKKNKSIINKVKRNKKPKNFGKNKK